RTDVHSAVRRAREVHTQKGEALVGHWVDHALHQVRAVRMQIVKIAAERNDAAGHFDSGEASDSVTLQSSAIHDRACLDRLGAGMYAKTARVRFSGAEFGAEHD